MSRFAVECTHVSKRYGDDVGADDIDLGLQPGEMLSIVGPSGSGKTTTIRLVAGFETLDAGEIKLDGRTVSSTTQHIAPEKRNVGMVFQEHALFPHKNVGENVAFGLHKMSRRDRRQRLSEFLELARLTRLETRYPHELSGGQQQRVALARALAPEPKVLLLDEPFSNLDADLRGRIRDEVKDILSRADVTVVFVTHDQEEALFMGDAVAVMNEGRVEQIGKPEEVFHEPKTRFTAEFLGSADFLVGQSNGRYVETELSDLPLDRDYIGSLDVMIRPDDLSITPVSPRSDEVLKGTVVGRTFRGISYLYQIELPSGAMVRVQRPHNEKYEPGTNVSVRFGQHYVPRYFEHDTLSTAP